MHEDGAYLETSIGDMVWGRKTAPDASDLSNSGSTYFNMSCDSLKLDGSKDVWCLAVDQLWLEFLGVPSSRGRPVPFVESFPVTAWISMPLLASQAHSQECDSYRETSQQHGGAGTTTTRGVPNTTSQSQSRDPMLAEQSWNNQQHLCDNVANRDTHVIPAHQNGTSSGISSSASASDSKQHHKPKALLADIHILVKIGAKVLCQINHYQYLFLMRMIENLSKTSAEIDEDTVNILGQAPESKSIAIAVKLSEAELAIIFPPTPVPGSSGLQSTSQNDSMQDIQEPPLAEIEIANPVALVTLEPSASTESNYTGALYVHMLCRCRVEHSATSVRIDFLHQC